MKNRIIVYAGQYYDSETGLHYNGYRYYDPQLGRYLRADPIGLAGGINPYVYVANNPVNAIDPLGLDGITTYDSKFNYYMSTGQYKAALDLARLMEMGPAAVNQALSAYRLAELINEASSDNEGSDCPVEGAKPGRKTKGKTKQYDKPGDIDTANEDFDSLNPENVVDLPNGGRRGVLPDGRPINVRPNSTDGRPTIEIQDGRKRIKIRYGD